MTIVRSIGVTTLVALMSAHRAVVEQCDTTSEPFTQATVEAVMEYLGVHGEPEPPPSTEPPRSYN